MKISNIFFHFFITFSFFMLGMETPLADCLPTYEKAIESKGYFSNKNSLEKMKMAIAESGNKTGAALNQIFDEIEKVYPRSLNNPAGLAPILETGNRLNVFCEKGKPVSARAFVADFPKYYYLTLLAQLAENRDLSPENVLEILLKFDTEVSPILKEKTGEEKTMTYLAVEKIFAGPVPPSDHQIQKLLEFPTAQPYVVSKLLGKNFESYDKTLYLLKDLPPINYESLFLKYFGGRPHPTAQELTQLAKLFKEKDAFAEGLIYQKVLPTVQSFLDFYGSLPKSTGSTTHMLLKEFLSYNPGPTIAELAQFSKLSGYPAPLLGEAIILKSDLVSSPQDLLDLYGHLTNAKIFGSVIDQFFHLSPTPTLPQVVALSKISHDPTSVLDKAMVLKLAKTPQEMLELYGHLKGLEITKLRVNTFIKLEPAPTATQMAEFSKLGKDPQLVIHFLYRNNLFGKDKLKTAQDVVDLFGHLKNYYMETEFIQMFFNKFPTIPQAVALSKISTYPQQILDHKEFHVFKLRRAQDYVDLYGHLKDAYINDQILDKFFNLKDPPTIKEVQALGRTLRNKRDFISRAFEKKLVKSPEDFLQLISLDPKVLYERGMIRFFFKLPQINFDHVKRLMAFFPNDNLSYTVASMALDSLILENIDEVGEIIQKLPKSLTVHERIDIMKQLLINFSSGTKPAPSDFIPGDWKKFQRIFTDIFQIRDARNENFSEIYEILQATIESHHEGIQNRLWQTLKDESAVGLACLPEGPKSTYNFYHLKEDLEKILEESSPAASSSDDPDCLACLEPCTKEIGAYACPQCKVTLCGPCLEQTLKIQLKDNIIPLRCDNCKFELPMRDADWAKLNISDARPKVVRDSLLAYHKFLFPKAKNCPTPDCSNRIQEKNCDGEGHATCAFCARTNCFNCQADHRGIKCEDFQKLNGKDEEMEKLVASGSVRKCFSCSALLQKSEGCNRVLCTNCHKNNLWDPNSPELKEWKGYDHHNATGETWKGVKK